MLHLGVVQAGHQSEHEECVRQHVRVILEEDDCRHEQNPPEDVERVVC